MSVEAGGKGTNVSRAVPAPVGGPSGEQFLSLLGESGIELVCVPVEGSVRMNVALAEEGEVGAKINAAGPGRG